MQTPDGPFSGMKPIQITDDGELFTKVETFFVRENTRIRLEYTIYKKNNAVDVTADVFMNDADRMLKIAVPCALTGTYIAQTAFGTEELYTDGRECVAQRYVAVRDAGADKPCLALFNCGTYGSSYADGTVYLSLVRGASYCAHPIGDRPIIPNDRFVKKIDMGERTFRFRLTAAEEESLDRLALEYNVAPYACNVFPVESDTPAKDFGLTIADRDIQLVTMKKRDRADSYILRLYNGWSEGKSTTVTLNNVTLLLHFGRYEVKTVEYDPAAGTLTELEQMII
jgi:alpha-mannosidase